MPELNSSSVKRAEYNERTRVLSLWFAKSGGPYDYYGVPKSVYDGLLRAASKGQFFHDYIRDQYRVSR